MVAQLLLEAGANPCAESRVACVGLVWCKGAQAGGVWRNPLDWAKSSQNQEMMRVLTHFGAR